MICIVCGIRYAPFPEEDFDCIPGEGIFPKNDEAEKRREAVFESDEKGNCGCHEEIGAAMFVCIPLLIPPPKIQCI